MVKGTECREHQFCVVEGKGVGVVVELRGKASGGGG